MIKAFSLATLLAMTACAPAYAQSPQCGPYQVVERNLLDKYGEVKVLTGIMSNGSVLVVFGNMDEGTWTAFNLLPNGLACFLASGEGLNIFKPKPAGEDM